MDIKLKLSKDLPQLSLPVYGMPSFSVFKFDSSGFIYSKSFEIPEMLVFTNMNTRTLC